MKRKRSAYVELRVRMKEPLRARIEKAAKARGVSMNAETIARLERSFDREDMTNDVRDAIRESLQTGAPPPLKFSELPDDLQAVISDPRWKDLPVTESAPDDENQPVATVARYGPRFYSDELYEEGASKLTLEERKAEDMRRILRDMKSLASMLNDFLAVSPKTDTTP